MNKRIFRIAGLAVAAGVVASLCSWPPHSARGEEPRTHAFFPFCIDWHDAKKRNFTEQAAMLKELGYDGVGHIWLDKVAERIESLDKVGLKLYQITMTVDLTPGKPAYDSRFKDVLALVKGRHVQFDLLVGGGKPSDPAARRPRRDNSPGDVRPGSRFRFAAPALSSRQQLDRADR